MAAAIELHGVSKHFRGSKSTYNMARDDLVALLSRRPRTGNVIRALEDIELEIPEGEAFGLVGENGAGKTTSSRAGSRTRRPEGSASAAASAH